MKVIKRTLISIIVCLIAITAWQYYSHKNHNYIGPFGIGCPIVTKMYSLTCPSMPHAEICFGIEHTGRAYMAPIFEKFESSYINFQIKINYL